MSRICIFVNLGSQTAKFSHSQAETSKMLDTKENRLKASVILSENLRLFTINVG